MTPARSLHARRRFARAALVAAGLVVAPRAANAAEPKPKPQAQPVSSFAVEGALGAITRMGEADSGLEIAERAGPLVELGVVWAPDRTFAFGLSFEHDRLGAEQTFSGDVPAIARIERSVETVWATVRAYTMRRDDVSLFLSLGFGPTWQSAVARGAYAPIGGDPPFAFRCEASGGAGLALGVGVGAEIALAPSVSLVARAGGSARNLSGDVLSDDLGPCAPGVGMVAGLDARLGVAWRFATEPAAPPAR